MSSINLLELIPRCHAGSRAKGFWDVTPNKGQQLMLVVSELAEALEADRKGRRADLRDYELFAATDPKLDAEWRQKVQIAAFLEHVKDSVEDELADAYIRLCDYAGGFGLSTDYVNTSRQIETDGLEKKPDNLGEMLLGLTEYVLEIYHSPDPAQHVGQALAAIEYVAGLLDMDLATHIDLKLQYNATRGAKHGKAY